jgi:phosphoribosylformylglycinamidine synthase PurS subunit
MKATMLVRLKADILDPQGKAVHGILKTLGYKGIESVRIGKLIELELTEPINSTSEAELREIAERVLSNPVIESFELKLSGDQS